MSENIKGVLEKATIMLVTDKDDLRISLNRMLKDYVYKLLFCSSYQGALQHFGRYNISLVICESHLAKTNVAHIAKAIYKRFCKTPILVISEYPDIQEFLKSQGLGGLRIIIPPLQQDELLDEVARSIEFSSDEYFTSDCSINNVQPEHAPHFTNHFISKQLEFSSLLKGQSPGIQNVIQTIKKVAKYDVTVSITGETGSGKELIAHAIHRFSPRKEAPFVPIDCGSVADSILESELFGAVKGAYTGAESDRMGLFEAANGGTLFLDEISNTSEQFQMALLRVIQDQKKRKLGDVKLSKLNVRIITATNSNLMELVKQGKFRSDLFYRINPINIYVPPLRERKCDIPLLIEHFISQFNDKFNKNVTKLSKEAMELFIKYNWNGNVRELSNLIEAGVIFAEDSQIELEDLANAGHDYLWQNAKEYNETSNEVLSFNFNQHYYSAF